MADKLVSMLSRFLEQNDGALSKRARAKEFPELKDVEVEKMKVLFRNFLKFAGKKIS